MSPRIFACILRGSDDGQMLSDIARLASAVDVVVVVEQVQASGKLDPPSLLRRYWKELEPHGRKLRHVVESATGSGRRGGPLNAAMRALGDADPQDAIVIVPPGAVLEDGSLADLRRPLAQPLRLVRRTGFFRWPWAGKARGAALTRRQMGSQPLGAAVDQILGRRTLSSPRTLAAASRPKTIRAFPHSPTRPPVVICCHLYDDDRDVVAQAFGLSGPAGSKMEVAFWRDERRIGPERAFEQAWSQFPDRDVIIIHPDMKPMPADENNGWYDELLAWSRRLPQAGLIACDLLYPEKSRWGRWFVQSGGGLLAPDRIDNIGGRSPRPDGSWHYPTEYTDDMRRPREVEWASFAGIFIRREVINLVGSFDPGYRWAYVMDVDYCMEARLRGAAVYQVPVNLLHLENGTTGPMLARPEYRKLKDGNYEYFFRKWRPILERSTMRL